MPTEINKEKYCRCNGCNENINVAKRGGSVAGNAKKDIENN